MAKVLLVLALFAGAAFAAKCPITGAEIEGEGDMHLAHANLQPAVGDAKQTTYQGCTCKTVCAASSTTGLANCDWCYTNNGCGKSSLTGSWDYCKYSADQTYESQSADAKLKYLWTNVIANTKRGDYPNILSIFTESVQTSFDAVSDVMPPSRQKIIHSVGTVCRFVLQVTSNSPYTGLFEAGSLSRGLIRMGPALSVSTSSGLVPGIGIKFMRSGVPSANFVALVNLSPLPNNNYNFFAANLTNHIPPPSGAAAILANKFFQASGCITQVGLSDVCQYGADGTRVPDVNFPFQVVMEPLVQTDSSPTDTDGVMNRVKAAIGSGTPIFNLYAYATPQDAMAKNAVLLGKIVSEDVCVTSKFGDASLFIKHQRVEEDWKLRPEWLRYLNPQNDCAASSISVVPPPSCASL